MQDRFIKATIYALITIAVSIFLLIQPFNLYCKASKKCYPVNFSTIFSKKGSKEVRINFASVVDQSLQDVIVFYPKENSLTKFSNEVIENSYSVKNLSNETITIHAKYKVDPLTADQYLNRIECLCFQNETLKAGEEIEMPIRFQIKKEIENDQTIDEINISYSIEIL